MDGGLGDSSGSHSLSGEGPTDEVKMSEAPPTRQVGPGGTLDFLFSNNSLNNVTMTMQI